MAVRYSRYTKLIIVVGDLIILNTTIFISLFLYHHNISFIFQPLWVSTLTFMNIMWLFLIVTSKSDSYNKRPVYADKVLSELLKPAVIHLLTTIAFVYALKIYQISLIQLLMLYVVFFFLLAVWRIVFIKSIKLYRKAGYNYRNVVIVGAGYLGQQIMNKITYEPSLGYRFLGFFDDNGQKHPHQEKILEKVEGVKDFVLNNKVDEIIITLPSTAIDKTLDIIKFSENNLIRAKVVPEIKKYLPKQFILDFLDGMPVITLRREPLEDLGNRILKRTFDIVFSVFVIIAVFPWLFPILAIIVKLSSHGPVLFKQLRTGKDNRNFWCWKFRTMRVNPLADSQQATKTDPRITKIGRFMRKTNLDELPQFFNVLKGEMSVIGPRPHMLHHTEEYSKIINQYMVRHIIKPGITGFAQINGYRGETTNPHLMKKRVQYDVWYIENWSFFLDLKIIFMTIWNIFKGEPNAG